MSVRLPSPPDTYDPQWARDTVRILENILNMLQEPANKSIDGDDESVYTIDNPTEKRSLSNTADIDDIRQVLATLLTDMINQGRIR